MVVSTTLFLLLLVIVAAGKVSKGWSWPSIIFSGLFAIVLVNFPYVSEFVAALFRIADGAIAGGAASV